MKFLVFALFASVAFAGPQASTRESVASDEVIRQLAARRQPLERFVEIAKGRVVAFGRAAYGVPAIAGLEARLAASEFDLVAADVGLIEGEDAQAWIADGKGDLEALLTSLEPWSFARAETRALFESLRSRNAAKDGRKVRFVGIGQGVALPLIERAIAFFDKIDPTAARRAASLMGPLRQVGADGRPRWFEVDAQERYLVQVGAGELLSMLGDPGVFPASMGADERAAGLRDLERLNQLIESLRVEVEAVEHDPRGRFLAENLLGEIARAHVPDARALALVSVRDLARASDPDSFAALFAERAKQPLNCIASAFEAARVRAIDPNALAKGGRGFATIDLVASGRTELELGLAKAGGGVFDVRALEVGSELATWIDMHAVVRSARAQLGSAEEALWPFLGTRDFDFIALVGASAR